MKRSDMATVRMRDGWAPLVLVTVMAAAGQAWLAENRWPLPVLAHLPPKDYFDGIFVVFTAAALIHLLPMWAVAAVAPKGWPRDVVVGAMAAFVGYLWQETISHGDGFVAHPLYPYLRWALMLGFSLGLALLVWLVFLPGRIRDPVRAWLGAGVFVAGLLFNLYELRTYHAFHGYLSCLNLATLAWVFAPTLTRVGPRWVAVLALAWVMVVANRVSPYARPLVANVRSRGDVASTMLTYLPLTKDALFKIEPVVNPNQRLSDEQEKNASRAFEDEIAAMGHKRLGKNVILLVLESTRADVWANKDVTKQFQRYKSQGLYVPDAVAQYPATPLAYGAMFTSLPPSVLVQNPFWANNGFASLLKDQFDERFLSQPTNGWFDHTAISRFIAPSKKEKIHRHRSSLQALEWLQKSIEGTAADKSFFAWAHLYDPHQPYDSHKDFNFGSNPTAYYQSEVAYLDARIGQFTDWFYASPRAKDTLFIIIGDHGEGLGEVIDGKPFSGHHVYVQNVVSHVPFFMSGPGVPKGQIRKDMHVAQMDLMPTVWDFLGRGLPKQTFAQGRSLFAEMRRPLERPLITEAFSIRGPDFFNFVALAQRRNADARALAAVFAKINENGTYTPKVAIQLGHWKLIRDMLIDHDTLYDIEKDPGERHDLSESNPEDFDRLRDALEEWRAQQAWVLQRASAKAAKAKR